MGFVTSTGGDFTNISNTEFPDLDTKIRRDLTNHSVLAVDSDALAVDTGVSMHVVCPLPIIKKEGNGAEKKTKNAKMIHRKKCLKFSY